MVRNRAGRVVNHIPGTQEGMMVSWELSLYTPVQWMARVRASDGDFYETTVPSIHARDAVVVREIPDEVLNHARSHDQMGAWSFPVLVEDAVPLRLQFIRAMVADLANLSPAKLAGILKSLPESDADFLVGLIAHVSEAKASMEQS